MSNLDLAVQFFLQITVILVFCRLVGLVAKRFGQPQVVAEMIAGVLLGPSVFGWWLPEWQQALFPWDTTQTVRDSQSYLFPASQLGLAMYMFVVGMEFRLDIVQNNFRTSILVSFAGMLAPFGLGTLLAWYFYSSTDLFCPKTSLPEAILFLGASLCITAFPMLARIIHFKGLTGTRMGTVAIGAGAIDDAAAWCFLAVVLSSFDESAKDAFWSIGGGLAFLLVVALIVRPLLNKFSSWMLDSGQQLTDAGLVTGLAWMAMGAWFTDSIHLHAVFGAFVMGTAMPRGVVQRQLIDRIQPLAVALFLPLFFTYSGLNTRIGVLDSGYLWVLCALVLLVAVAGKGVACWLAAWCSGISHREALGIGALMNARGLMELIIINIGMQRGVISERLFVILALMAVFTTLMASPIFDWLMPKGPSAVPNSADAEVAP